LFLFPMAPLLALVEIWRRSRRADSNAGGPSGNGSILTQTWIWKPSIRKLVFWCLGAMLAAAIWPAMWADPIGTIRRTEQFVVEIGSTPHAPGNFFLGQPIADPGPFFYPMALALRLGPAIFLGVLLLPAFTLPRRWRWPVGVLGVYLLLFGLGLTVSHKKVDRYILPLFPAIGALAALGWWMALRTLADRFKQALVVPLGVALIVGLQYWPLATAGQDPLSAYNPLLGGIKTAERVLPVGWGEGLDLVGAELKRQPNADKLVIAVWYPLYVNFQAHAPGRVVNITFSRPGQVGNQQLFDQADYYVDYIHARQRRFTPRFLLDRSPDFSVVINGAEYARVYRLK
jgi:hypothetical protein